MKLFPVVCVVTALALATGRVHAAPQTAAQPAAKPDTTNAAKGARTVELTAGDTMQFSQSEITARPGETLHVVLKSTGTMPKVAAAHNFVLLKPGSDPVAFNAAAFTARE